MKRNPKIKVLPLYVVSNNDYQGGHDSPMISIERGGKGDITRPSTSDDETSEALAEFLDHDAENCNAHDYCGTHAALGALLEQEGGRDMAQRIMRRLMNYKGLHGMMGICGHGDHKRAARELGIKIQ